MILYRNARIVWVRTRHVVGSDATAALGPAFNVVDGDDAGEVARVLAEPDLAETVRGVLSSVASLRTGARLSDHDEKALRGRLRCGVFQARAVAKALEARELDFVATIRSGPVGSSVRDPMATAVLHRRLGANSEQASRSRSIIVDERNPGRDADRQMAAVRALIVLPAERLAVTL
jgi:hypothetical protein